MTIQSGTALITGASTGLGAVYADRLARRGHDLILVARNGAQMEELAAKLRAETGVAVDVVAADLTKSDDVTRIEQRLIDDAAITLFVNNAGMSLNGGTLENSATEIQTIIALNITAAARLAIAAGKAFGARGKGAIVNIASVLALAPETFEGVYSGSKAFLLNLSLSLANSLRERRVHVQAVLPGATRRRRPEGCLSRGAARDGAGTVAARPGAAVSGQRSGLRESFRPIVVVHSAPHKAVSAA